MLQIAVAASASSTRLGNTARWFFCSRLNEDEVGTAEFDSFKNRHKFAFCAPSHNFVGLYLSNEVTYRQSEKNLVKQQYLLQTSP